MLDAVGGVQTAALIIQTDAGHSLVLMTNSDAMAKAMVFPAAGRLIDKGSKHENNVNNWRDLFVVAYANRPALAAIIDSVDGNSKVFALLHINAEQRCLEKLLSIPVSMATLSLQGIFKRTEAEVSFLMVDYQTVVVLNDKFVVLASCKIMNASIIDFSGEVKLAGQTNKTLNKTLTQSEVKDSKDDIQLAIVDDSCNIHLYSGTFKSEDEFEFVEVKQTTPVSIVEDNSVIRKEVFLKFIEADFLYLMAVYQKADDDDEDEDQDDDTDSENSTDSEYRHQLTYTAMLLKWSKKDKKFQVALTETKELQEGANNLDRLKVNLIASPRLETSGDRHLFVVFSGPKVASYRSVTLKRKKKTVDPVNQVFEVNKKMK